MRGHRRRIDPGAPKSTDHRALRCIAEVEAHQPPNFGQRSANFGRLRAELARFRRTEMAITGQAHLGFRHLPGCPTAMTSRITAPVHSRPPAADFATSIATFWRAALQTAAGLAIPRHRPPPTEILGAMGPNDANFDCVSFVWPVGSAKSAQIRHWPNSSRPFWGNCWKTSELAGIAWGTLHLENPGAISGELGNFVRAGHKQRLNRNPVESPVSYPSGRTQGKHQTKCEPRAQLEGLSAIQPGCNPRRKTTTPPSRGAQRSLK